MEIIKKHSLNFYKSVFKKSNSIVLILLEGGQIIDCNDEAVKAFGFSSVEEMLGLKIWELFSYQQENVELTKKKSLHYLSKATNWELAAFEWIHKRKNGEKFEAEVRLSRFDSDGNTYIQAVLQDISKQKELERALLESLEKAEESIKLKTNFLANMSHDIRNPLNAILGFSKMIAEESDMSLSERQRYGALIESNGSKLLDLISDIVDMTMIEQNKVHIEHKRCEVNALMEELFLSFKKEVNRRENLKLKLDIAIDDPKFSIMSDPMRLHQILSNLLDNAIKYSKQGVIEFGYEIVDDANIQFFVKDTGVGIAPEYLDKIFDRFSREKKTETIAVKGSGLGLDISKRLVKMLGGKIWAFSTLDKGSEFYFIIPVTYLDYKPVENKEPIVEKKTVSAHDINWSHKHILIADDDVINFELLRIILSKTKVKITKAENGQEAVDLIKQDPSIDLLLTDIQMPIMSGYEVVKEVRTIRPDLRVIAQTAVSFSANVEENVSVFDDYTSKPINVNALLKTIEKYFKESL